MFIEFNYQFIYCLIIIVFPFLSTLSSFLFGKYFSFLQQGFLTTSTLFVASLFSLYMWYDLANFSGFIFFDLNTYNFYWYCSPWLQIHINFLFDEISLIMLFLVTSVSTAVHLFSLEYMKTDPSRNLFLSYLSLFTFFMLILITAGNFVQFFIGWEGIGLCSYLLINFWYMRIEANKAAIKAVLVNKIGDCALILGVGVGFNAFATFNFLDFLTFTDLPYWYFCLDSVFVYVTFFLNKWFILTIHPLTFMTFFFLIAVMCKSAQIGFHTWLPDAMEGPTPVSALIHAATMVTAGIYLVIRLNKLFEYSSIVLSLMVIIGALTAVFAASVALLQTDLKKMIAYSTCSQLGYMLVACGLSKYGIALFHLMLHGFFKALLFLVAGAILHSMNDVQETRYMRKLAFFINDYFFFLVVGSFSLGGLVCFGGYYSKDLIIFSSVLVLQSKFFGYFIYFLLVLTAFFTIVYSFSILKIFMNGDLMFFSYILKNTNKKKLQGHSYSFFILFALLYVSFWALILGFFLQLYFINLNNFQSSLHYFVDDTVPFVAQFFMFCLILISYFSFFFPDIFYVLISGVFIFVYQDYRYLYLVMVTIVHFLKSKWYFDNFYNNFLNYGLFKNAIRVYKTIDLFLLEIFGPKGLLFSIQFFSNKVLLMQTGLLPQYISYICFTVLLFLGVCS